MGAIAAFDHHLSLAQTSLDITHPHRWCLAGILRKFLFLLRCPFLSDDSVLASAGTCPDINLTMRASQGRIWPYGSLGIDDNRQRIVVDLHGSGPILGDCLRLADHDGHRMTAPQHFLLCKRGLRTGKRINLGHSQRFSGKNSHDSWQGQSSRCIYVQNACMGIRARNQAHIKHPWQHLISRVARISGHFIRSVLAGERRANRSRLRLLLCTLRHRVNSSFNSITDPSM